MKFILPSLWSELLVMLLAYSASVIKFAIKQTDYLIFSATKFTSKFNLKIIWKLLCSMSMDTHSSFEICRVLHTLPCIWFSQINSSILYDCFFEWMHAHNLPQQRVACKMHSSKCQVLTYVCNACSNNNVSWCVLYVLGATGFCSCWFCLPQCAPISSQIKYATFTKYFW